MFGDNEVVVNKATILYSKFNKRNNALAYHKTRGSIAAHILCFIHIKGICNPTYIISKHWDYNSVKGVLQPTLFWEEDTEDVASYLENGPLTCLGNEGSDNGPLPPTTEGPGLDS